MIKSKSLGLTPLFILGSLLFSTAVFSDEAEAEKPEHKRASPWLGAPMISSNPKLGTSLGLLVGYLHSFDEKSPVSMFGAAGTYSNTDSYIGVVFGNLFFDEDKQRLIALAASGNIKNDYSYEREADEDININTTDDISMAFLRYSMRIHGNWFLGGQVINTNYIISGSDPGSDFILDLIDLTGFDSTAIGLVATFDSRDNQRTASSGQQFLFSQFAYRESLGGDESFDAYQLDYSTYLAHGAGHVAAVHAKGRLTNDAPAGGFSSMELRGYIRGQYLAEHATFVEVDERYSLTDRWGLAGFVGLGCLYGNNLLGEKLRCSDSENLYPGAGGGVIYVLRPEEKIVLRAEFAVGKEGNRGFYLKFGQPF